MLTAMFADLTLFQDQERETNDFSKNVSPETDFQLRSETKIPSPF